MELKNIFKLILAIALCELAGGIGSVFTVSSLSGWYDGLTKPWLNPPSWIFGPVWITLYLLMGIAVFLVWTRLGIAKPRRQGALLVFAAQLIFNAIWSAIFFGQHNLALALTDVILLWFAILATVLVFGRISKPAAYLLWPYLIWVSFALYLNLTLWLLN